MDNPDYIETTEIQGVLIIKRQVFEDDRGFFRETFRKSDLEKRLGYQFNPVQANHSRSKKGTLRGIHAAPWNKLVTVTNGEVQQIVVDLRKNSQSFGKYISITLGDSNRASVFVPEGCGNAFLVLSDEADYNYLTTDYWTPGKEIGVIYNDPTLNIPWKDKNPVLSAKDLKNPTFKEIFPS